MKLRSHRYSQTQGTICPSHSTHSSILKEAHKQACWEIKKPLPFIPHLPTENENNLTWAALVCVFRWGDALKEPSQTEFELRSFRNKQIWKWKTRGSETVRKAAIKSLVLLNRTWHTVTWDPTKTSVRTTVSPHRTVTPSDTQMAIATVAEFFHGQSFHMQIRV